MTDVKTKSILWKDIPIDVHRRIRKAALNRNKTVPELLTEVVEHYFKTYNKEEIQKW